jgi:hypothetical protein
VVYRSGCADDIFPVRWEGEEQQQVLRIAQDDNFEIREL